jgi:hypothetical protein
MNNEGKGNGGFWLGVIVGGAAVFLLGTKTGRNLLKNLSEQGLTGVSDLIEDVNMEDFEEEEEEIPSPIPSPIEDYTNGEKSREKHVSPEEKEAQEEKPKRRFFRKFKK